MWQLGRILGSSNFPRGVGAPSCGGHAYTPTLVA
jgi:hypothetical protein